MKSGLKTTTAILASLNLAVPFPALAQDAAAQNAADLLSEAQSACADGIGSAQCNLAVLQAVSGGVSEDELAQTIEGLTAADVGAADAEGGADSDASAPVEGADAEGSAQVEAEAAPDQAAQDAAPEAQEAPAEQAEAPAEAAEDPALSETLDTEPPVEDVSEAEPIVEAPLEETAETPAEDGAAEATAVEPEADDGMTEDAPADAEAQAETSTDPASDEMPSADDLAEELGAAEDAADPATADAEAEAGTSADAESSAETESDAAPDAAAEDAPVAPLEAETAEEPESAETAEEPVESGTDGDEATGAEPVDSSDAAQDDGTDPVAAETETSADAEAEAEAEVSASEEAALEGSAVSAAAAADDAEAVESETVTVTEESARSSAEDFDDVIQRAREGQPVEETASNDDDDDDGLSDLEKALVLGAGALAVGALVRGNRQVVASSNDRVVVSRDGGEYELIKDDNALLRRPGAEVQNETFDDGSSRSTVTYEDGSQVVTIRDPELRVIRRVRVTPDGERVVLINDLDENIQPVDRASLQQSQQDSRTVDLNDEQALREALAVNRQFDRSYSLAQVRSIAEVRGQVPAIDLEAITFDTGSAAIRPEQAEALRALGQYIRETVADDPRAVFLIEGHTDAVGDGAYNLALSDRRAESVALALGEYFDVPTSNMVVQGYGERFLKVSTDDAERANRRATIRDITPLLQTAAAN